MNILHLSTEYNLGGSGRAAYRIHSSLLRRGHASRMLVSGLVYGVPEAGPIWRSLPWRAGDWFARSLTEALSLQYLFLPSSWALLRHPWFRTADVVQLYNTHGGYFSHSVIGVASRRKPFVWRLSDMWPLTGHCCYSYECDRWKTGCGTCPLLSDEPALRKDRTALLWRAKQRIYAGANVTLVAPSRWIAGIAAQSPLVKHWPVEVIPNGLNLTVFRPVRKAAAREVLGLPQDEAVILFSSVETKAYRKGGTFVTEAVHALKGKTRTPFRLLVVGNRASEWERALDVPVTTINAVKDDHLLATLYSAADVFLHPALADNLPNGVLESLACGTPVVAFDVGGVGEAVRPMETGYLARDKDAQDLAAGLQRLLDDDDLRRRLGIRCRAVAEAEYDMELQTQRFEALYQRVLRDR
ncbi:MAG: glycosyltransferase family 4 protein [Nitrospira sp.]|nr:glycosyltransferase family 4 protein [Nitrospira sp.]